MRVKTGELRNHLSRYLKRVRQTGDPITVMDRSRPIATIMPHAYDTQVVSADVWTRRAQFEAEMGGLHEDIQLPTRHTRPGKHLNPLD